ncbi:MAG: hypothetical protein B6U94_03190 [Thermofilum sp. ex4484_79]|nr:MAG: hypothetical protein B6U94_03190 [Thermofilum sp. ex4484_79]
MKNSTVLLVGCHLPEHILKRYQDNLGVKFVRIEFDELREEYEKVDENLAKELADKLLEKAEKIIEPNRETMIESSRIYYALKKPS